MNVSIEIWEFLILPFYLLIPFGLASIIPKQSERNVFLIGVYAKVLGVLAFTFVYFIYYGGGDTIAYFSVSSALRNLLLQSPLQGLEVLFSGYSLELYSYFDSSTGYPYPYICSSPATYLVSKITSLFSFPGLNSYMLTSVIMATVFFLPFWELYKMFIHLVPEKKWISVVCALLIPSVLIWGGGVAKDSIASASLAILITSTYWVIIRRKLSVIRIILSVIAAWLIITIKAYIFLVFFPSALIWVFLKQINTIKNRVLRAAILPASLLLLVIVISVLFSTFSDFFGSYSSETIIEKAIVSQEDLKRDFYGGNHFDIGKIQPTTIGVLSKFPLATFWGFYGPTLLNINNAVMLLSALETTILLYLTIAIFALRNPITTMNRLRTEPFLTFCLVFSVAFAFGIGLSTPNFGALVRFKIPMLPLFSMMLFTLYYRLSMHE